MDLEALLANLDAFKARLDNLETELKAKDAELEKVTQNRDSILKEKRQLEGRGSLDLDALDKRIAEQVRGSGVSGAVTISRADARDGAKYREARAAAEKAGVPLMITDAQTPVQAAGRRSSPVKYVSDSDAGELWANVSLVEKHGQQRMRQLAAEKGATLRVFRSVEDLPAAMQQAHAQAIADRAPGTLLEGGE